MDEYKEDTYLLDNHTKEHPEEQYTERTDSTENEDIKFLDYRSNNKRNDPKERKNYLEEPQEEITISIEHIDEIQHKNEMTKRHSENDEKNTEMVEETLNVNDESLSIESDGEQSLFVKQNGMDKINVEEYEQVEHNEYEDQEEENEHEEYEDQEEEQEYAEEEEEQENGEEEEEEMEENNDNNNQEDLYDDSEEKELSSKYEEKSVKCNESTSECKNESHTENNEEIYSERDEKMDNSNEASVNSEFEFHFRDQISDNFKIKSKGLFKLALTKKEPFFEGVNNDKNENKQTKKVNEELQTHTLNDDDKDQLIEDLRKQIVTVIAKYTEETEKLADVQKENFEMEQLFKNKYYMDVQKEKDKLNEMVCKNKELIKIINEYNTCLEHINQRVQNVLSTVQRCSTSNLIEQGSDIIIKNMKHVLILIDSAKRRQHATEYDQIVEETFTPRFHSVGLGITTLNEIYSNEPFHKNRNLHNLERNQESKVTNLLQPKKNNYAEYQNNANGLIWINQNTRNTKNASRHAGSQGRNLSNSSKWSNHSKKTSSSIKEKKNKKVKSQSKENRQHLWDYIVEPNKINTRDTKNRMKTVQNECKFNTFQNKCALSTSSEDILNLFNKTRKYKYLLQTTLNSENKEAKSTTRSMSKKFVNRYNKNDSKPKEKNYFETPNKTVNIRMVPMNPNQKRTVSICLVPNEMPRTNKKNSNYTYIENRREPLDVRKTIGTIEKTYMNNVVNATNNLSIHKINSNNPFFPKKTVNIELNPKTNSCSNNITITTTVTPTSKHRPIKYLMK